MPEAPETVEKLPELLHKLEHEMMEEWNTVRQKQRMPDIEAFGENVKILGVQYGLSRHLTFGEELLVHVTNFDIDQMRTTLETYPDLVAQIQQTLHSY